MESKQLFRFIADVATLAARHLGESQQAAEAEAEPPEGGQADTKREEELISSFASEFASVLDEDEGGRATARDGTLADAPTCSLCGETTDDFRQFARGRACYTCLWSATPKAAQNAIYDNLLNRARQIESLSEHMDAVLAKGSCGSSEGERHKDAHPTSRRGRDIEVVLYIDFSQMVLGATVPVRIDVGGEFRTVEVTVPAGVADNAMLTLRAQGGAGEPPGDLLVRVRIAPDLTFTREGNNITMRVPVPPEALTRKKLSIDAPTGSFTVPITAEHLGQTLRCQGKGIASEGQQAGDLLIALDPGPVLAASLDQFPSAAVAFAALRSLCPAARAHLANLANLARQSSDQRDIREILWGLAVAHERGLRSPIRGFASQLVSELVKHGSLRSANSARSRRSHVFAWLGGKSSLLTRERPPRSPSFVWTVHLERLGDEGYWSRTKPEAVVTH
jgi:hypothetical protein